MRYHTTDPADRAMDIATRDMEIAYRERRLGNENWAGFWLRLYWQYLRELLAVE